MRTEWSWVSLALAASLAGACAPQDYTPIGDEQADDRGECDGSDLDYAQWLDGYKASEAFRNALSGTMDEVVLGEQAIGKPCVQSDDAFLRWFGLWDQLWLDAVDPSANDYVVDDLERAGLEATLLAMPDGSGAGGYVAWLERYTPTLSIALRPILNESNTAILEDANTFNTDENTTLSLLERAQPSTTGRGAYAAWVEVYDGFVDKAVDPIAGNDIAPEEAAYLDRVVQRQPGVSADIAYLSWLERFRARFAAAASATGDGAQALTETELVVLDGYQSVRAQGVGERPYLAWQGEFTSTLSAVVNNSTGGVSEVGRSHLEMWLAARPCGQSDAIADAWARLEPVKDRVDAEVAELIAQAEPSICE